MLNSRTRATFAWSKGSALRVAGVSFVLAVAALRYRAFLMPMVRMEAIQVSEYAFVLFSTLAIIALYAGFGERLRMPRFLQSRWLILLAVPLLGAAVYRLGMHQFGGFDEGLVAHAAACYRQGMRPYADFLCTVPPFFMAGIRADGMLFGLRWGALQWLSAGFTAVTTLWMYWLLRRLRLPREWALLLTVMVELCTMVSCPFWWYNNTSIVLATLVFLSVLVCLERPELTSAWLSLAIAIGMVLAAKPNTLPILALVVLFFWRPVPGWRARAALAMCFGVLLAAGICRFAQMPLRPLLASYAEVASLRGNVFSLLPLRQGVWPERDLQIVLLFLCALGFAAAMLAALCRRPRDLRPVAACAIAGVASLLMGATNAEWKHTDLSLLLLAVLLLNLRPWEAANSGTTYRLRSPWLVGWLAGFLLMSVYFSAIHLRIWGIGEAMFYEPAATVKVQGGFLDGLEAAPRLRRVQTEVRQVLDVHPGERIFFGPRMEFEYAAMARPPLSGKPLLWDSGNLFAPSRLPELLLRFQQHDPDVLIFLKNDFTRMGIVSYYIQRSATYRRDESYSDLTVFVRDRTVPISLIRLPR